MIGVMTSKRTPRRTFVIAQKLYDDAKAKAASRGETVSDVVRRALERYVKR